MNCLKKILRIIGGLTLGSKLLIIEVEARVFPTIGSTNLRFCDRCVVVEARLIWRIALAIEVRRYAAVESMILLQTLKVCFYLAKYSIRAVGDALLRGRR